MQVSRDAMTKGLNRKRFTWVDQVMREELPTDIYGAMHSEYLLERLRATAWLKEQGYRISDEGEGIVRIMKGSKLVRQTKLVLELTDPNDMLAVMEAMHEHIKNLPPPPWQPTN
jgi:hypothetical protein